MHIAKFKKKVKRFISVIVAATMVTNMMPTISAFAATSTTTYSYNGYTVDYTVVNEWDNGQSVEVKITNTSEESILNWALKYNSDGIINGIWNAKILENQGDDYIIKNNDWNYEIAPNQSVTFGYTLTDDFSAPDLFELHSNRVDVKDGYTASINVTESWENGINGEIVITNTSSDNALEAWMLAFDSNFAINNLWNGRFVENENNHYVVSSEMWTNPISVGSSMVIGFTASIDTGVTAEISNCVLSEVQIESLEINWEDSTDTDGDGLPDVYEKNAYNTDHKNPDSDGDNLPDGYEVITSRTNPALPDSDDNGVTDGSEDYDTDGLSNYEEFVLGTNPYLNDTDEDYLKDGEEVNSYDTDPLNPDTDDDTILDSDEVLLGLDPTNPNDGDTPVKQYISEGELRINRYNEEFKISIELEASNNIKNYIKQDVSEYVGILSDNKAIVGTPIDIEYNAGVVINGTITFRLDQSFVDNNAPYYPELGLGMERYGIFVYDEDIGTLIPVECSYDEENYSITIDAENMGNLMVIDQESLLYDLGIMPEIETYDFTSVAMYNYEIAECEVANKLSMDNKAIDSSVVVNNEFVSETSEAETDNVGNSANEVTDYDDISFEELEAIINGNYGISTFSWFDKEPNSASTVMEQVDLVLVVDTTGSMGSQIFTVKSNIADLINDLRQDGISLYVSIVDYRDITCDGKYSTKVNNNSGEDFYNSNDEIITTIDNLKAYGGGDFEETAIDGLGNAYNLDYRNGATKFVFLITDATYKTENNFGIKDMKEISDKLSSKGIYTSVVTNPSYYKTYEDLTTVTNGTLISMYGDFCSDMYEFIYSKSTLDRVVIANSLVTGHFNEPLVKDGDCDTDFDTLSDSSEIDWGSIRINSDGSYTFPTWGELSRKSKYKLDGINMIYERMKDVPVIPALSNPFSQDTDKDYYPDDVDEEKTKANPMYIYDNGIDDSNFHKGVPIPDVTPDKFTDGVLLKESDVDNNKYYAQYSFKRAKNSIYKFVLKPEETSFYKISCNGATIDIYSEGWFGRRTYIECESNDSYLLNGGKEYTIELCVNYDNVYDVNFTIEQDNWVYAPHGGYDYTDMGYFSNETIYMDGDSIYNIIKEARKVMYNEEIEADLGAYLSSHTSSETNEIPEDVFYNMCNRDAELFIDMQVATTDDINGLMSNIGNIASVSGVVLLAFPQLQTTAIIVTLTGGATAVYSVLSGASLTMQGSIRDAMIEGEYNVEFTTATSTYHPYNNDFEFSVPVYSGWTENTYIYKFLHDRTKKDIVIAFDECRTVKFENGEWSYQ